MARYTLTAEDRRKGGQTTSKRYDMRARGRAGLQALANKYFDGNIRKAGEGLSRIGNFITDPSPSNRVFQNLTKLPQPFVAACLGHCESVDDGVPF